MRNRTMVVRVVAIILCVLMVFGVIAGAVSILAHGAEVESAVVQTAADVETGSRNSDSALPIIIGVAAFLLLAFCVVLPRFKKKPAGQEAAPGQTDEPIPEPEQAPDVENKEQ